MKTTLLLIPLLTLAARAADTQTIDLGNGTSIEVKDGRVSVKSTASGGGSQSASSSVNSHSNGDGTTTATVTSERNGQKVTRTVTIDKDGKATLSENGGPGKPLQPGKPAAGESGKGGWLGVHTAPLTDAVRAQVDVPAGQGIVVEFTAEGGPAAQAGLQVNDILLKLNAAPIESVEGFRAKLKDLAPGSPATLDYMRKGKAATANAVLGQRPPDAPADDKVTSEAERLLREMQAKGGGGSVRRTVVVGPDGKTTVTESSSSSSGSGGGGGSNSGGGTGDDAFDALLNDPNVPEEMKAQLRKTREEMRKLQEQAGKP